MTTVTKTKTALFDASEAGGNMKKADAFLNLSVITVDDDGVESEYKLPKGLAMHLATTREAAILKHAKANPTHTYELRGTVRFATDDADASEVNFK